jgi:hypothetical protein
MLPEDRHWTDNDILHYLYGVSERSEAHLEQCDVCRQRMLAARARMRISADGEPMSNEFLLAQRGRIYERIEAGSRRTMRLRVVSALLASTAAVLVILNVDQRPDAKAVNQTEAVQQVATSQSASTDADLYREISAMVSEHEPRAGRPMRALFLEDGSQSQ